MLPFTRQTPARVWLGFVREADAQPPSILTHRVLPVIAVAGLAVLIVSGGKQGHDPEAPPPSSAAAARTRMAVASAGASQEPAAEEESAAAEDPAAEEQPAPAVDPEPEPTPEPEPATDEEPKPAPEPKPKRTPKPPEPLSPAAAKKAERAARGLRGALSDGRASASRENFAIPIHGGEDMGFEDAKQACSDLRVDGVGGWRLPSRGEAREIDRGGAAPERAYWTRQRGRHDDTIYVYDPRTRRSSPWLDVEIARGVCVQPKPR